VRTNIRAPGRRKERQFGWIEGWTDIVDEATGQSRGMTLTCPIRRAGAPEGWAV
jgi:hypothetical protein